MVFGDIEGAIKQRQLAGFDKGLPLMYITWSV